MIIFVEHADASTLKNKWTRSPFNPQGSMHALGKNKSVWK